jgi:hypothetical protein
VLAVGCVLAVWAGLFALFTGLGLGLWRLACRPGGPAPGAVPCCWLGYAAAVALLQIWHLMLPVDHRALGLLVLLSVWGWLAARTGVHQARETRPPRLVLAVVLAAVALGALWLADRAIGPAFAYDSANYHLTLIRWFNRYAIVPGLANLNPVYGVNLSGLLIPAVLEVGPGTGRSSHFVNGFLVLLLLLLLVHLLGRRTADGKIAAGLWGAVWLFYPAVTFLFLGDGSWISSPATDVPVTAAVFAACALVLQVPRQEDEGRGPELDPRLFIALALLAVTACLKTTAAVFAAAAWMTLMGGWLWRQRKGRGWRSRPVIAAVVFATLAIAAWLARGAVLSGYPLFPSSFAALDVDWRLPVEHVEGVVWWTRAYTRTPEAWDLMISQEGASWLPYWLRTELRAALHEVLVPVALTVLWIGVWLAGRLHGRAARAARGRPSEPRQPPPLLLVPLGIAIPAWFLLAPATRYGLFLFWVLCAQTAALFLPPVLARLSRPRPLLAALAVFAIVTPLALHAYYTAKYRRSEPLLAALQHDFWTPPGPDHGFHPLYEPVLDRLTTCRDLEVFVPAARAAVRGGAPWPETLPWDAPLPATALLQDGLCPRRPGDLGAGFRTVSRGLSWPERNAAAVGEVRRQTGWGLARLAVYFCVRPELVEEGLRRAGARHGS